MKTYIIKASKNERFEALPPIFLIIAETKSKALSYLEDYDVKSIKKIDTAKEGKIKIQGSIKI